MASQNDKKAEKKPNLFVRIGRKLKETFSELKRVTWPTFPKVVKGTCVVLVVVVIFTVAVTVINYGLQELLQVITNIKGIE
ncbi:MAG: preprotein translocase subunit SecE [Clostridia bacterium]|nr:preprotein translocase subunit SecE [Clostridia bacterium]